MSISRFAIVSFVAGFLGLGSVGSSAGEFGVWTYSQDGARHIVSVSFASDGVDQEAMVDFWVPQGFSLTKADALVEGAICVGLEDGRVVRVAPPSGAGSALPSKETDYCRFEFEALGGEKKVSTALALKKKYIECSAPGIAITECDLESTNISE